MRQKSALIVFSVVTVALLALGIASSVIIWSECREAGHSALYCMSMVTR
tara:strand:+ start:65 stop:211 length:147 start_codon:yes stop_codon:yes gene_type:complete